MGLKTVTVIVALVAAPAAPPASEDDAASRESVRRVLDLARQYEFSADRERKIKFDLQPKPLLTYSNPVRGDVHGSVFVWTRDSRPEVVGAFFDFRSESKLDSELHTLAGARISGWRDGKEFWNPTKPGVKFESVPGSQAPAATPVARLR